MTQPVSNLVGKFVDLIVNPAILLIFALGFFFFVLGFLQFLWGMRSGEVPDEGKQHMFWGLVGMFIMVSVYGIIALLNNTLGLHAANPDVNRIDTSIPTFPFGH